MKVYSLEHIRSGHFKNIPCEVKQEWVRTVLGYGASAEVIENYRKDPKYRNVKNIGSFRNNYLSYETKEDVYVYDVSEEDLIKLLRQFGLKSYDGKLWFDK